MFDLAAAMESLVEIAKRGGKDWEYGQAVQGALTAYNVKNTKDTKAAFRLLEAGLPKATDRGHQVLHLALGALVEAGASPELAWPAVDKGFVETLETALDFANTCLELDDTPSIQEAVKNYREVVKKKKPRGWVAWDSLRSRCLAAVATLSRSAKLRAEMQKSRQDLMKALEPLEDEVEEAGFVSQVMRVLGDQTMLAIHPEQRRGFRVEVKEVTTNLELFVLLSDAIVGDAKKGLISGRRPNARAVAALKNPDYEPKTPPEVVLSWHLSNWTAIAPDGSLPEAATDKHDRYDTWIWFEGVPLEIPAFEGERVILFHKPIMPRTLEVEGSFSALIPQVRLKEKLTGAELDRLFARMAMAAPKAHAEAVKKREAEAKKVREELEKSARRGRAAATRNDKNSPPKKATKKRSAKR